MELDEQRRRTNFKCWDGPIFWAPLYELMCQKGTPGWSDHQKSALKAVVCNVYWNQRRIWTYAPEVSPSCTLCHGAHGTTFHRRFECVAHEGWRREMLDPVVARAASRLKLLSGHDRELFSRGLFPDPSRFVTRPPGEGSDPYTR